MYAGRRRSWRRNHRVELREQALDVGGQRLVPGWGVAGREGRGHFGGEGGRRGERVADRVLGQRGREDHEDRVLDLSTVDDVC